jgi:CHAT domain-containing protein
VPDRQLSSLPFAVLFDGERYLIERYSIRYAPSAARADDAPGVLSPAVAFADPAGPTPLPFSRIEAEQVSAVYGGVLITGADATRARFLESLQNSALVHYAGHADSDAGTYGALMLAPSGKDSGLLAASEIARLSLRQHPLVVLSACGTLRGEDRHVAGMPTLARAFLTAGARAVVGTQWEVDDDLTTPLFLHFHQELRAGQAPARALRSAQIAMLQTPDPRFRHPAAWSAVAVLSNV